MNDHVSPIRTYMISALSPRGNTIHTFVQLSEEQEANHGGVDGAAMEARIELRLAGYGPLQFVGACPIMSDDEFEVLVEQFEMQDQRDIEDIQQWARMRAERSQRP